MYADALVSTRKELQRMAGWKKLVDFEIQLKRKCLRVSSMIKLSGFVFVLAVTLMGISTIA